MISVYDIHRFIKESISSNKMYFVVDKITKKIIAVYTSIDFSENDYYFDEYPVEKIESEMNYSTTGQKLIEMNLCEKEKFIAQEIEVLQISDTRTRKKRYLSLFLKPFTVTRVALEVSKDEFSDNINNLVKLCHGLSKDAGWHENPREVGTMLALIHSEVSEALEGFRKDLNDDHLTHRKMAEVELADAVIRIFDLAGAQGFDLGGALVEKLVYNTQRADHKIENRQGENGKKF